jgi:DNA invertase Pin-like site-specific DNA recombinase
MAKKRMPADDDGPPRLVGLVRVSTGKQEESGLGLDAQRAAIERYRAQVGGVLLRTYTEVESGTHDDIDSRPQLRAAVADAGLARARLVIAKIDRMVRSTAVMAYLKASSVRFVACDNPHANELTIDILVAVAADEARRISTRTREALAAYKAGRRVSKRIRAAYPDGVPADVLEATAGQLGASLPQCRNLTPEASAKGTRAAAAERTRQARAAYAHLTPLMSQLRADGLSLGAIGRRLTELGHRTVNGCPWNRGQVKRVLDRLA